MPSSTQELLAMARQSVSPPLAPFTQRIERDIVQPLVPAVEFIVAAVTGEPTASEPPRVAPSTETTVLHHAHTATQVVTTGLSVVSAIRELPSTMMQTGAAMISNAIVPAGYGMPALNGVLSMHVGLPHAHVHPPSCIPPAPPIPLLSGGIVMGAGCVSVLINGMPAIRTGDFGFALTCGTLGPTFEIITGSASVYIGGKRAARGLDFTRICNPLPATAVADVMAAALSKSGVETEALSAVNDIVGSLSAASESADACAASAEASDPNEAASLAADAVAMAADAQGQLQSAMLTAAQMAADVASAAATALIGVDPGILPGFGTTLGVANGATMVKIGGLPMPPWELIKEAAAEGLRRWRARRSTGSGEGEGGGGGGGHHRHGEEDHGGAVERHLDANGLRARCGDPVDAVTGNVIADSVDLDLGKLLRFTRHYENAHRHQIGACGRGAHHFYERVLRVYLDRCVYVSETGAEITFPAFRGRDRLVRFGAVLTREKADRLRGEGRYRIRHRGVTMTFAVIAAAPNAAHDPDAAMFERALLTEMESPEGHVFLRYRADGSLLRVESIQDRALDFHYAADGLLIAVESAEQRGHRVTAHFRYDDQSRLIQAIDACGGVEQYAYDFNHCLTSRHDQSGYPFRWRYDEAQRCIWTAGEGGYLEVQFEYKQGATHVTAPGEGTGIFHHNALGVLTRITFADGTTIEREIDAWQWCQSETDAAGRKVEWLYDETGHHFARRDRFGNLLAPGTESSDFEAQVPSLPSKLSNQLSQIEINADDVHVALGMDARFLELAPESHRAFIAAAFTFRTGIPSELAPTQYNAVGLSVRRNTPRGALTGTYDSVGNLITVADRDGSIERIQYAHRHLPQHITDGNGHSVELAHTASGQIARLRDALGSTTDYLYTTSGRVESVIRHGRIWESYVYAKGILVEKKDTLGQRLIAVEPHVNALPKKVSLSSGEVYRFDYNAAGKVIEASSSKHDIRLRYDTQHRRLADRRDGRGVTHRHDAGSTRGRIEHTFLERFRWETYREQLGPREVITLVDKTGTTIHLERYPGVAIRSCSNGAREILQFREDGHLIGQALFHRDGARGRWCATTQYVRSAEGDIRTIWDSARGERQFEMDAAHRLVAEHNRLTNTTTHYTRDAADNLIASRHVARAEYVTGNLLLRADHETFTHDARGRIASRTRDGQSVFYEYDSWDQLTTVRDGQSDWHADYDGLGRRISSGRDSKRTQLYWDGDRIAGEIDHRGHVRVYLYLDETSLIPVAFIDYESEHASPESGRTHHVFHDATGMPHHIESASGQVVWRALEIDAYGSIIVDPKSAIDYHLRWPGHRFDQDTGLHYNRYRDYDPKLGRYIEPDPLGHAGGVNLYAYSKNPMVDVDLLGLYTACRATAFVEFLESIGRPLSEGLLSEGDRLIARFVDETVAAYADARHRGEADEMGRLQREWDQVVASMGYGSRDTVRDRVASPDPHAPREARGSDRQARLARAREEHHRAANEAGTRRGLASDDEYQRARTPGNSPEQVIARRNVIAGYVGEKNLGNHLGGHDLSQPVFTGPPPTMRGRLTSTQPSRDGVPANPQPGEYLARASDGFTPDEVGITDEGRYGWGSDAPVMPKEAFPIRYPSGRDYLQSVCNPTNDHWSLGTPVWTGGGGIQVVFIKRGRDSTDRWNVHDDGVRWLGPNEEDSDDE